MIYNFILVQLKKSVRYIIPKSISFTKPFLADKKRLAFVAPAPTGSLGDQALLEGFKVLADKNRKILIEVLVDQNSRKHEFSDGFVSHYQLPQRLGLKELLLLAIKLIKHPEIIFIGADTLDGSYNPYKNSMWISIANFLEVSGMSVSFISFSFSDTPNKEIVQKISDCRKNIKFCARDTFSKHRFENHCLKPANLVADLAFLMPSSTQNTVVIDFLSKIETQRKNYPLLIGLNVNYLGQKDQLKEIVKSYSQAITSILNSSTICGFVLIPHDFREGQSDLVVLNKIYKNLDKEVQSKVFILNSKYSAWDAKKIVGMCDLVFTGRMHLAISAMSQCIPIYCFSYKDKFEGLMKHYNISNNLMNKNKVTNISKLKEFLDFGTSNYLEQRKLLEYNNSRIKLMAELNI